MNTRLTPITPVRPIAAWLGGKRNLAKRFCAIIDADEHRSYAEPFVGMGGIFLRRSRSAQTKGARIGQDRRRRPWRHTWWSADLVSRIAFAANSAVKPCQFGWRATQAKLWFSGLT